MLINLNLTHPSDPNQQQCGFACLGCGTGSDKLHYYWKSQVAHLSFCIYPKHETKSYTQLVHFPPDLSIFRNYQQIFIYCSFSALLFDISLFLGQFLQIHSLTMHSLHKKLYGFIQRTEYLNILSGITFLCCMLVMLVCLFLCLVKMVDLCKRDKQINSDGFLHQQWKL